MTLKLTIAVGLGLMAVLVGLDIYLVQDQYSGNTWSEILRTWAVATPVIPWAYGVLGGHFYHPVENLEAVIVFPGNIALLVWLTAAVGIAGLAFAKGGHPIAPWVMVLPGMVAGSLLWPV
jgi:hypothetical protein